MSQRLADLPVGGGGASKLLKFTLLAMFVFPPYMVISAIGASGSMGQILAMILMGIWLVMCIFGIHKPWNLGFPGRAALICWVLASCISYVALFSGLTGNNDVLGRAAADRWMLLIFAGCGLTLSINDSIRNSDDLKSLVRWLLAGASFCSFIAIIQFITVSDPMEFLTANMVGFTSNGSVQTFQPRGSFMRVAGTTMHPIELGVVTSMILPLAVWSALFDRRRKPVIAWGMVGLILAGNFVTVSRSGMLGLAIAVVVLLPFLPKLARRWAFLIIPPALAGVFMLVPGMLTTLFDTASAGSSDSSITYRTDDYPLAIGLMLKRPLFGLGPGTWMPLEPKDNFDNQFLLTGVTLGLIGLVAMVIYILVPCIASISAGIRAVDDSTRLFCGAVVASLLVAFVGSGTFDSFSFPVFALVLPVIVGLSGVAWRSAKEKQVIPSGSTNNLIPHESI